jgi:predicted SnoaL-like aldol condensation-catalyzing enzyme
VSRNATQSLHEEAVAHAVLAERAGEHMWTHIRSEYTQDPDQIAATLATDEPLAWTLALPSEEDGSFRFLTGTTVEEIRDQYAGLRVRLEIHGWEPLLEIRQSWYVLTQGVSTLRMVPGGETSQGETVVLFPVGGDGVLGELQVGTVGRLPDGRPPVDETRLPERRRAALRFHDEYIDALLAHDVDRLVQAHAPVAAVAMRSYLTDESTLLHTNDPEALTAYFTALFEKYRVLDVRIVNRMAETWYVFSELHWIVEEREGARRTLAFCTAELAPLDAEGRYWIRTGTGTDPVEV